MSPPPKRPQKPGFPAESEVLQQADTAAHAAMADVAQQIGQRIVDAETGWEYHVELLGVSQEQAAWMPVSEQAQIAAVEKRLNELGSDGWELAGYGPLPLVGPGVTAETRLVALFKRPIRAA
jgi:hypothetical protein